MHLTPSPDVNRMTNPFLIARTAVLNGEPIPADVQIKLAAQGVDVGALESRLIQAQAFRQ